LAQVVPDLAVSTASGTSFTTPECPGQTAPRPRDLTQELAMLNGQPYTAVDGTSAGPLGCVPAGVTTYGVP
jgi:hypothetical protein